MRDSDPLIEITRVGKVTNSMIYNSNALGVSMSESELMYKQNVINTEIS